MIFQTYVNLVGLNGVTIEIGISSLTREKLGQCLGPAANYSNEMSQYILKDTMYITASHTVRCLTEDENRDLNIIREKEMFMVKC